VRLELIAAEPTRRRDVLKRAILEALEELELAPEGGVDLCAAVVGDQDAEAIRPLEELGERRNERMPAHCDAALQGARDEERLEAIVPGEGDMRPAERVLCGLRDRRDRALERRARAIATASVEGLLAADRRLGFLGEITKENVRRERVARRRREIDADD